MNDLLYLKKKKSENILFYFISFFFSVFMIVLALFLLSRFTSQKMYHLQLLLVLLPARREKHCPEDRSGNPSSNRENLNAAVCYCYWND